MAWVLRAERVKAIWKAFRGAFQHILSADPDPDARLVTGPRGGRISTAALRDTTHGDAVVTGLGYEHLRRHDLRHAALTRFADTGGRVVIMRRSQPGGQGGATLDTEGGHDTTERRREFGAHLAGLRRHSGRSQRQFAAVLCAVSGAQSITRNEVCWPTMDTCCPLRGTPLVSGRQSWSRAFSEGAEERGTLSDQQTPPRLSYEPDDYLCTWNIPDGKGGSTELPGQLEVLPNRAPKGSVYGRLPLNRDEPQEGVFSSSFPQVAEAPVKLRREAHKLMASTGVRKVRLYDARHACLSWMANNGVPDTVVSAWAGHSVLRFTKRTYVHPDPQSLRAGSEKLAELLG